MAEIAGLKLIVPSSVAGSGVSVSASGKVTFTAATDISVNGCFTSSYDNYIIVYHPKGSSSTTTRIRMRASGSDATANNYVRQNLTASSTSVTAVRQTGQDGLPIAGTHSEWNGYHVYLYGPYLAQPTAIRNVGVSASSGATIVEEAGTHSLSTSYDGFTFYVSGGPTLEGSLCVYGLSQ